MCEGRGKKEIWQICTDRYLYASVLSLNIEFIIEPPLFSPLRLGNIKHLKHWYCSFNNLFIAWFNESTGFVQIVLSHH